MKLRPLFFLTSVSPCCCVDDVPFDHLKWRLPCFLVSGLVSWSCQNRVPQAGCLKTRYVLFHSSGDQKSESEIKLFLGSGSQGSI